MKVRDKHLVMVTGGGRGIGADIVERMASRGHLMFERLPAIVSLKGLGFKRLDRHQ